MTTITIQTSTIIKTIAIILGVWFLFSIKQILAIIFFALILSSAIDNSIDKLVSKKIPRVISVLVIFLTSLSVITILIISLAGPITDQGQELIKKFPHYHDAILKSVEPFFGTPVDITEQPTFLQTGYYSPENILNTLSSIFGGITSFILIMVLTFYMSIETQALKKALSFLTPQNYLQSITILLDKVQDKIGDWIRGQLFLSCIVSIIAYIGLSLLGIKYALLLAILAGIAEFIPYIGPATAALTAIFLAFSTDPIQGVFVAIFYGVLQSLENHLLVPKIMQKALGLNPIIIICSLLIGIRIGGIIGALLAIPTATAIAVIIQEIQNNKNLFRIQ